MGPKLDPLLLNMKPRTHLTEHTSPCRGNAVYGATLYMYT